jgi:hypothetical protein
MSLHPHVPEDLKHFGKHLLATFLGLLMALGLEQWREHRTQARFTREALHAVEAELASNLQAIDRQMGRAEESLRTLDRLKARIDSLAQSRRKGARPDLSPFEGPVGINLECVVPDAWEALKAQGLLKELPQQRTLRLSVVYRHGRALPQMARDSFLDGEGLSRLGLRLYQSPGEWAALSDPELRQFQETLARSSLFFHWARHELELLREQCQEAMKA